MLSEADKTALSRDVGVNTTADKINSLFEIL